MSRDLTKEEFIARLVSVGWTPEEAEAEYQRIQDDDEDGYDGP